MDEEFELNDQNFAQVEMHNREGFVIDDRQAQEYSQWRSEPCMENCKDEVRITMRSVFLVEEPPEGGSNSIVNPATVEGLPSFSAAGPSFIPEAEAKPVQVAATTEAAEEPESADAGSELIAKGEKVFKKCRACHTIGEGAKNRSGPQLNGILGRTFGSVDGFGYSKVFKTAAEEGRTWDADSLEEFLMKPSAYMKGTKMKFAGLKKVEDIEALILYLGSAGG